MVPNADRCPHCDNTKFVIRRDDRGVNRAHACTCVQARRPQFAHGVPREFQDARLENYRTLDGNQKALTRAKQFADSTRDLYLVGGTGTGKTRLACSILNDQRLAGVRGIFARVPWLLLQLQPQATDEARASAQASFDALVAAPVVVLDDIGAERDSASDFTRRTLLTLYEARGDVGRRTIWTSNLKLHPGPLPAGAPRTPTLGEFMGDDRLASRIAGRADVVLLSTPDQRLVRRVREDAR